MRERRDGDGGNRATGKPQRAAHRRAGRQIEERVEPTAARIVEYARDTRVAEGGGIDVHRVEHAVEGDGQIFGGAELILRRQRFGDRLLDLLCWNRPRRARDGHFGQARGVEAHERVFLHGGGDRVGRYVPRRAEVGRAEDRHFGDDTGVVDEIADLHHVGIDGGVRFQHGVGVLRVCGERKAERDSEHERAGGAEHGA
jgi:hypothetical protein